MILAPVIGLSLAMAVAFDSGAPSPADKSAGPLSAQQKSQIMQPLVRSATECILRSVAADPRIQASIKAADVRDLIVEIDAVVRGRHARHDRRA